MNTNYNLLTYSDKIEEKKYGMTFTHDSDKKGDIVMKDGRDTFMVTIPNPMRGYGMFRCCHLFHVHDDLHIFVQVYEHSRGGHTDPFMTVLNAKGQTLWHYGGYGYDMSKLVINQLKTKIWYLNPYPLDRKWADHKLYSGCNLEELSLSNGKIVSNQPLNMPQPSLNREKVTAFIDRLHINPVRTQFVKKDDKVFIKFSLFGFSQQEIADISSYLLEFTEFEKSSM